MNRRGTILVVDDTPESLRVLTGILQQEGYTVRPANSGELALASIAAQPPDLILLDIRMPGLDGFEVCRRLKAAEATRNIPVIFQSVATDLADRLEGFRLGAVDYISKPFQREELLARVKTHLELALLRGDLELLVKERTTHLEVEIAERKRAEEELSRLNRELRAISTCNQVLMKAKDEAILLGEICRIVCDEAGYRMAAVGYAEHDAEKSVRLVAWGGVEDNYLAQAGLTWADTERGRGPAGVAIRSCTIDCSQDIATDPRMAPWRENARQRGYRSVIALPLKDENGRVFGIFLIYSAALNAFPPDEIRLLEQLSDDLAYGITALRARIEREQAEHALRLSDVRFGELFNKAAIPLCFVNKGNGALEFNASFTATFGYSRADVPSLDAWWQTAYPDPDYRAQVLDMCSAALQRAETNNGAIEPLEYRVTCKNGEVYTMVIYGSFIGQDLLLTFFDITARKLAEQVAQARFRMLEASYTAGITLDDSLRLMLDVIEAQVGSRIAFYHFLEEDQQTLALQSWSTHTLAVMCTAQGKGSHYPVAAAGVWADCVRERHPVIHNDYPSLPHRKGMPEGHAAVARELVVPVFRGDRVVAIVGVGNKPEDYTEADVQAVSLLGDFSWEIVKRKRVEESLRTLNEELEQRVKDRTAELERINLELGRMNKVFVGRELRMMELKERIKELEKGGSS